MTATNEFDLIIDNAFYQVSPGRSINIPILLVNKSSVEDRVQIVVEGIPTEWVTINSPVFQIKPKESLTIQVRVQPPRSPQIKPGRYSLVFQATSLLSLDKKCATQANLFVGMVILERNLGLLVGTTQFSVEPGARLDVPIFLFNRGPHEEDLLITSEGISAEWLSISDGELRLAPGGKGRLQLGLQPPRQPECRAGRHAFNLVVRSRSDPHLLLRLPCLLNVAVYTDFQSILEPAKIYADYPGKVVITNHGNIPQKYHLEWLWEDGELQIKPGRRQDLRVQPGEEGLAIFAAETTRRPWFGRGDNYRFKVQIRTGERETHWLEGEVLSRARLSWQLPGWGPGIIHSISHYWGRLNWPLALGGLIVGILALLAFAGPYLAPQDPMQQNFAFSINGQISRPPYPPFTIPGYFLGTDEFGRDLLSRILWGIRPTVYLVLTVALIRLILGNILGLWIGWSTGMVGKLLEGILSISLAIPVLIVALMGITAVGIEKGFSAFIFGLALTGWAETARIISTQTRIIKHQSYIEAARASGASDFRLIVIHIWRQLNPLLGMLLAFEISSTLFVVAELGFLGYFIGGGIWVEISDFFAINAIGLPELGQLLSTALISLVKPLPLLLIGSVIFFTILGFNLLGEGLRLRLSRPVTFKQKRWWRISERISEYYEASYRLSLADWIERNAIPVGITCVAAMIIGGWSIWWLSKPAVVDIGDQQSIAVPGGHHWATELHDAQGSQWAPFSGPRSSQVVWMFQGGGSFAAGPVVDSEGNVYISSVEQRLIALDSNGVELWNIELPFVPVGSPALGPSGDIYVTGNDGSLAAFATNALPIWTFTPKVKREATSGPIVDSAGNIYYTSIDHVQAVSAEGEALWRKIASDVYMEEPPILSAGESYLFLKAVAVAAENGSPLDLEGIPVDELKFTSPEFFVGANQKTYFRSGHEVYGWRVTESGIEVDPVITWGHTGRVPFFPNEQGATPEGLIWLFYTADYSDSNIVWLDKEGKQLSHVRLPDRQSNMIAVDRDLVMYICSNNFTFQVNCSAWGFGETNPSWTRVLGDYIKIVGGALAPDRLYIATENGQLFAVGAGQP